MGKTEKILLLSALVLLGAGWSLYHLGSQQNLAVGYYDSMLWEQAPGDKWLYVGGVMMLISGSLAVAAFRFWLTSRKEAAGSSSDGLGKR
jgi:cytochrome c oxidase assembly factor CtaG